MGDGERVQTNRHECSGDLAVLCSFSAKGNGFTDTECR